MGSGKPKQTENDAAAKLYALLPYPSGPRSRLPLPAPLRSVGDTLPRDDDALRVHALARELGALIEACWATQPAARPTADEVADRLEALLARSEAFLRGTVASDC